METFLWFIFAVMGLRFFYAVDAMVVDRSASKTDRSMWAVKALFAIAIFMWAAYLLLTLGYWHA